MMVLFQTSQYFIVSGRANGYFQPLGCMYFHFLICCLHQSSALQINWFSRSSVSSKYIFQLNLHWIISLRVALQQLTVLCSAKKINSKCLLASAWTDTTSLAPTSGYMVVWQVVCCQSSASFNVDPSGLPFTFLSLVLDKLFFLSVCNLLVPRWNK